MACCANLCSLELGARCLNLGACGLAAKAAEAGGMELGTLTECTEASSLAPSCRQLKPSKNPSRQSVCVNISADQSEMCGTSRAAEAHLQHSKTATVPLISMK